MNLSLVDIGIVFFTNFLMVFLLGIQSKNVMNSLHLAASVTTVLILSAQTVFIQYVKDITAPIFFISAIGCIAGINCSILFYDKIMKKQKTTLSIDERFDQLNKSNKNNGSY